MAVVIVVSLVGLWVFAFGFFEQNPKDMKALLYLLVSAATFGIAGQLSRSIVRQANAAPTTGRYDKSEAENSTETSIETLRRRYAEGELSDEEFQRRLDRLLETEKLDHSMADRKRVFE